MPKIAYIDRDFAPATRETIATANGIIEEYAAQGFQLTLRQLYYQFVSRGLIANKQSEYSRLGSVINDGRLAGLIDWESIVDRTRNLKALPTWADPQSILKAVASQYREDRWRDQDTRLEVWIEKDALVGVIEGVCKENQVPFFSCRGYTSQSEMWSAAMRFKEYAAAGQNVHVIHLGDHDPSGKDMSRDIGDRITLFMGDDGSGFSMNRIALNMNQVEQYNPPPNPAKITDSRAKQYILKYGRESWELDALEPTVLAALIRREIGKYRDVDKWAVAASEEDENKDKLQTVSTRWHKLQPHLT